MKIKSLLSLPRIVAYIITITFLSAGYLFLTTQKGLDLTAELSQKWLPGTLKIKELNGCLLGPIQIKDLHYTSTAAELSILSAQFDWHWSALLRGKLSIAPLSINTLILSIKEQEHSTTTKTNPAHFKIPSLLRHIHLSSIDIKKAFVYYGTNVLALDGTLDEQWHFNWQLTIPELANLISEAKGQLVLKGKVNGKRNAPEFYITVLASSLKWNDWQLEQIQGQLFSNSLNTNKWLLNLTAKQLKNNTFSLKPMQINLAGNLQPFSLQGSVSGFKLNRKTENNVTSLDIPSSQLAAKLTSLGLETTLTTEPKIGDQLSAAIQLPYYQWGTWLNHKQMIKGSVQLTLKHLNYLTSFIPTLKNPQGLLNAQFNFSGPIFSPLMNVTFNVQKASTQIPSLGLNLKNINLAFHTQEKVLRGTGQVDSGKGSLAFQSQTQLDNANFASVIKLNGNNVEISHTPEYKIIASPALHIQADTHHVEVTGLISLPKATIKINENNLNLVELSNDVVFVNHKQKATSLPFTYKNTIKLQLGNDIRFIYQGLRTKVTGVLDINQTTDRPTLATGELALTEGEYTYYGQSLKLQPHSLLSFANSPIDNPNLDITANKNVWVLPSINTDTPNSKLGSTSFIPSALQTTQPIRAIVGVHLQGYLENPQITLYADPASAIGSQLEILSYLVTGQPSNQLSAASLQLLMNAAAHVGGKETGFNRFINTTQKKIGIDQLTIGANPIFNPNTNKVQQNTSIIIGKNFSPRLNVSYSLGLLDPISVLQINYLLNKHFSLQSTNSNFANGIDLLYKLERK